MTASGLKKLLSEKKVQLPDEKPEMYYQAKVTPIGMPPKMRCPQNQTLMSDMPQPQKFPQHAPENFFHRSAQPFADNRKNPFMMGSGDVTLSTTMPTEFINQMMRQPQFHPSNPFNDIPANNQSFYERNLKFQQQQHYQAMKRDMYNSGGFSTDGSMSTSSSQSAYEANLQQQYSLMSPTTSFYGRFDPPKPDTPPSKPLWLDPVWNCDGNFFENRMNNNGGNTGNSESVSREFPIASWLFNSSFQLKAVNFHVVSPFLSFKTMFTFDNPNQNSNNGNQKM